MRGEKVAKRMGVKLFERKFTVYDIIGMWNEFKPNEIWVSRYIYKFKKFMQTLKKVSDDLIILNIQGFNIDVYRMKNKFKVIIHNIIKKKNFYQVSDLHDFINTLQRNNFYVGDKHAGIILDEFRLPLYNKDLIVDIVVGKPSSYIFQYSNTDYYVIKVNGKNEKYFEERIKRQKLSMPIPNRILLRNRKIQYAIFKMLEKKGVIEKNFKLEPDTYMVYPEIPLKKQYDPWAFTNAFKFTFGRIETQSTSTLLRLVLVDYDYDGVNQILLKLIDVNLAGSDTALLCGLDYRNVLWCFEIPSTMQYWRIRNMYKYMYQLNESVKIYEF